MSVKVLKLWITVACKSAALLHPPSLSAQLPSLILIVAVLWVFSNDNQFHPFFPQPLQHHWYSGSWE